MNNFKKSMIYSGALVSLFFGDSYSSGVKWKGPYVGATLNGQQTWVRATSDESVPTLSTTKRKQNLGASVLFGSHFMHNNFLYGLEVDLGTGSSRLTIFENNTEVLPMKIHASILGHAKMKFGYLMDNNTLPYVGLGVSMGRFMSSGKHSTSDIALGFAITLGVERALNEKWRMKAELGYDEFSSVSGILAAGPDSVTGNNSCYSNIRMNSFKIGISYKL